MPKRITHVVVPGSAHRMAESAQYVRHASDSDPVEVTLLLRYPSGAGPRHADEHGTRRPHERPYLTHDEFEHLHGASSEDLATVAEFARTHGLRIIEQDAAQRLVTLTTSVDVANRVFNVPLCHYDHDDGSFRGHEGHIHVPSELDGIVVGVFGLNDTVMGRRRRMSESDDIVLPSPEDTPHFTPAELASIYDFPDGSDGTGQCIALMQFEAGYTVDDLEAYFNEVGVPIPSIEDVSVAGAKNTPIGKAASYDAEVMLDIEVAGAAAPGAKLAVYFAPNSQAGWVRAMKQVVHDTERKPSVISISWSKLETVWDQQTVDAVNDAFKDAAALGITVCCSSGDFGSADKQPSGAHVNFPGSSPYVLTCGGTRLTASEGRIESEVVWNELDSHVGATGGGVSVVFPRPDWQDHAGIPAHADDDSVCGRGLPDVAANADPMTGYLVRVDGKRFVSGGTSASTPLWAALVARINQSLGHRAGFISPIIYCRTPESGALRSITEGHNGAYHSCPGWNACTGWGSPNGARLLDVLRADQ